MSTFLKELGSKSPLLARLHLVNSSFLKDPLKLSLSSHETKISILRLLKTSLTSGSRVMIRK